MDFGQWIELCTFRTTGPSCTSLSTGMCRDIDTYSIFSLLLITRWLHFEKVINALLSEPVYYLSITKLRIYAKKKCFIHDQEEFTTMVNFYHDLRIIIKHRSTVILSTQWLIDLFGRLITIPDFMKMVGNTF